MDSKLFLTFESRVDILAEEAAPLLVGMLVRAFLGHAAVPVAERVLQGERGWAGPAGALLPAARVQVGVGVGRPVQKPARVGQTPHVQSRRHPPQRIRHPVQVQQHPRPTSTAQAQNSI